MSQPFDMELFLAGVLTGSHITRQRHLRQAKTIQTAIAERAGNATIHGLGRENTLRVF